MKLRSRQISKYSNHLIVCIKAQNEKTHEKCDGRLLHFRLSEQGASLKLNRNESRIISHKGSLVRAQRAGLTASSSCTVNRHKLSCWSGEWWSETTRKELQAAMATVGVLPRGNNGILSFDVNLSKKKFS